MTGAGFDPAFIPGLTAPASGADATPEKAEDDAADAVAPKEQADTAGPEEPTDAAAPDEVEPAPAGEKTASEPEPDPGGPVFEAADFRARIVADHRGVHLRLDDQECEFRWDEIGAVETETPRFGRRYTVTVHTPDRRWYPIEVVARSRSQHQEWDALLDEVLDAYFEEGAADGDDDAAAPADDGTTAAPADADAATPADAEEAAEPAEASPRDK